MTTIFTHHSCASYFPTPGHLHEHLWTAHPASTLAVQTALGQHGLDRLIMQQRLHTTSAPPGSHNVHICAACQVLFPTLLAAQSHLEHTPRHAAELAHARRTAGHAGIARLVTPAWVQPFDDVALALTVANYTSRPHYPPLLVLAVVVPRDTATVGGLARCVETAFVAGGGGMDKIRWGEMVQEVGIVVRGRVVVDDEGVRMWVRGAGAQETGRMDGEGA